MEMILYMPTVPTGGMRSRGWGRFYKMLVLIAEADFKNLNSKGKYKIVADYGIVRYDGYRPTMRSRMGKVLAQIRKTYPEAVIETPRAWDV